MLDSLAEKIWAIMCWLANC